MRGSAALLAACTAALGVLLLSVVDEASFAPQHHVITAIAPHEPPRNAYECAVSHVGAVRDIACEFWIVVTGADSPRTVALFKTALARQWCAVFVETPGAPGPQWRAAQHAKTTSGIFHLPLDAQLALPFASANVTGGMRKNLGYLFALQRGAKAVFDFDASVEHELLASGQDLANWAVRLTCNATSYFRDPVVRGRMARMHTWCPRHVFVNPLPDLGPRAWANASAVFAWPFGFPRHLREDANTFVECAFAGGDDADDDQVQADRTGVVHFPVVVRDHVYFAPRPKHFAGVALPAGTLSLFDSRSTLFLAPAFFGLALLPAGASSDALRSLVVSRVLWDTGVHVAHAHPLSARLPRGRDDNDDNVAVSRELVDAIAAWRPSEEQPVPWRMLDLLVALQRRGLASAQQLGAMRAWLCDLQALNVSFPALRSGGGAVGSRPQPQAASEPLYFARERDRLLNASFAASILVRMYGGDRKFHYYWQRLSELFVDRDSLDVVIVLDEDAPGDYEFAAKYFQRHGTRCTFEPLPANASQVFTSPFARLGYQRQIYSTLFCDNHTFSDAVGVVDSDLMPFGLLSAGSMFCSSDGASEDWKRRKLKLYGEISASHWPADSVMLNTSGNVDFMYQGVFPYWYWRTTFPRARAHMSRVHDNASVEELWARYTKLFVPVPTHPTANVRNQRTRFTALTRCTMGGRRSLISACWATLPWHTNPTGIASCWATTTDRGGRARWPARGVATACCVRRRRALSRAPATRREARSRPTPEPCGWAARSLSACGIARGLRPTARSCGPWICCGAS